MKIVLYTNKFIKIYLIYYMDKLNNKMKIDRYFTEENTYLDHFLYMKQCHINDIWKIIINIFSFVNFRK